MDGSTMAHNEDWFDRLYRRHRAALAAYLVRRIGPVDAPDALSEVFAVLWRRRSDVPPGDRALPWLYGVARNVVSHHWRSTQRSRRLARKVGSVHRPQEPGPEVLVVERSEHSAVRAAMAELRPSDREVLMLSAWEGLSHREIAEVVGCSQAAVDKRLVRAKARLARQYDKVNESHALSPARKTEGGGGR